MKDDKGGKGKRHRRAIADSTNDDLLLLIEALSSNDKKIVFIAAEEGDEVVVNSIFSNSIPTNDIAGRYLLDSLCERKIGKLFKKCDEAPAPATKKGKMSKKEDKGGKGDRHRRTWEGSKKDLLMNYLQMTKTVY